MKNNVDKDDNIKWNIILLFHGFKEKLLLINTNNKYSNIILLAININY